MYTFTKEEIKEIVEQFSCGMRGYFNTKTKALLFIPSEIDCLNDEEFFIDEREELENNCEDYLAIERPTSTYSFEIMANFTEQILDNNILKNELNNALSRKKPFREFKFIIDNSGSYRQNWFDFKNAEEKKWVEKQLQQISEEL
jgi:Uncharacterised protein family (UPF0158)